MENPILNALQCSINLPNNYSYSKTRDNIITNVLGGGPVGGIQFFLSKSFSILTEIPVYVQYNNQKEVAISYRNSYTSFNNASETSENQLTQLTKTTTLVVMLPVTIYLCLKF